MGAHNACNLVNRVPVNISHQQVCLRGGHGGRSLPATTAPEEVRHAPRNADSAYLFCIACDGKKGTLSQHFVMHVVPPLPQLSPILAGQWLLSCISGLHI